MTPLQIEIALWYYARACDYRDGDFSAPAVAEALSGFVEVGLLKRHEPNADLPQRYIGTEGLRMYVQAICQVLPPVQEWVWPDERRAA